ncbi:MAG: transcriptional repressor [bacterium]|nr:transcriptional repressor [bacterium]
MGTLQKILNQLRDEGLKITKYRIALLELFTKNKKPLTVAEILSNLASNSLEPNKTTIYREIDSLIELGHLQALDFGDDKKRYELSSREHHHHLICQKCDIIEDVVLKDDIQEIEKKVQGKSRFKIKSHSLEFFGLCLNCQL